MRLYDLIQQCVVTICHTCAGEDEPDIVYIYDIYIYIYIYTYIHIPMAIYSMIDIVYEWMSNIGMFRMC